MRYKVPQNVQREDQILWFFTLKQLLTILVGGGISYALFSVLNKSYNLGEIEQILIWIPAGISVGFAFLRIKGVSLFKFVLLIIEQSFFRPPKRHWIQNAGTPFVSMTMHFSMPKKKKTNTETAGKVVSDQKIRNIAEILDQKQSF